MADTKPTTKPPTDDLVLRTPAPRPANALAVDGANALIAHLKSTGTPQTLLDVIAKCLPSCTATNVLDGIGHAVRWAEREIHPVNYAGTIGKARQYLHDQTAAMKADVFHLPSKKQYVAAGYNEKNYDAMIKAETEVAEQRGQVVKIGEPEAVK